MKLSNAVLIATLGSLCMIIAACTIEQEPEIPSGKTNEIKTTFLSTELIVISHDSVVAKAKIDTLGNLNIKNHGWVWSESQSQAIEEKTEKGALTVDYFTADIGGLAIGKTYHFKPFILVDNELVYGPEKSVFMGIPRLFPPAILADSACLLHIQCTLQSPSPSITHGIVYRKGNYTPTLQQRDGQIPGTPLQNDAFQCDLTMLSPNTTYTIRAYATTALGVGYSPVITVNTPTSTLLSADFTINTDDELFQGAIVKFSNKSIGASSFIWNFGDGTVSGQSSPEHTFDQLGIVTVRLTAQHGGCTLMKDTLLKVINDPFKDYWAPLPGGTFWMGCTPGQEPHCGWGETPAHKVLLSPFNIGKTEVTQKQWEAVTGNNPSNHYQCGPNCPVEYVSWDRIHQEFLPALFLKTGRTHRLPTEAEWEYAARGGEDNLYSGSNDLDLVGWSTDVSPPDLTTQEVAKKQPNGFGLYDMSGNVSEWCSDYFDPDYYANSPIVNPTGPPSGNVRAIRGGNLRLRSTCRVSYRGWAHQTKSADVYESPFGFRLVQ